MKERRRVVYHTVYRCDRCGKEYNYLQGVLKLNSFKIAFSLMKTNGLNIWTDEVKTKFDLCSSCAKEVYDFMKCKEKKDDICKSGKDN